MGWMDEDLSDIGVWQAERLSRRLAQRSIKAIYSSPLKRACRTAEMVALPHSLPVQVSGELGEIRIGEWEGMHAEEIATKFPDLWRTWRRDPTGIQIPGGESLSQVQDRAVAAFEDIARANKGRQVLVVTHDVVVRLVVAHYLGVTTSVYRRLEVANASLTVVELTDGRGWLRVLNDTAHLEQ